MAADKLVFRHASAAETANGNSGLVPSEGATSLLLLVNISAQAGTNPTVQFFVDGSDEAGTTYPLYSGSAIATLSQLIVGIGPGLATNIEITKNVRLRWVIGGTAGPSETFEATLYGR